jgi:hypothetical protein
MSSSPDTKPVFSDYSHLGTKVEDITFAVRLRSDANEDELLARYLMRGIDTADNPPL